MWSSENGRFLVLVCALLVGATAALTGCGGDKVPEPAASASARVDDIDPDTLPEGTLELFGIRFPAKSSTLTTMSDYAVVKVPFPAEKVANYLTERVESKSVDVGPTATVYSGAVPKGSAGGTAPLTIIVKRQTFSAEVILRR